MSLRINDEAPNFTAETTQGNINFHDWIGNGWAVLFSHPKDFTPVCTTELGYMAGLNPEFQKRNTKIIGLSVDPVGDHTRWSKDIEETQGHRVTYPLIGDPELKVAKLYDMLPAEAGDTSAGRTAATNATVRSVFVVGPDKKIKAMLTYPMTMYFPLVVHGALLIEPTETESKASLDQFAAVLNGLAARAKSIKAGAGEAATFHAAPRLTPRRRLDETAAARKPVLRWRPAPVQQEAAE